MKKILIALIVLIVITGCIGTPSVKPEPQNGNNQGNEKKEKIELEFSAGKCNETEKYRYEITENEIGKDIETEENEEITGNEEEVIDETENEEINEITDEETDVIKEETKSDFGNKILEKKWLDESTLEIKAKVITNCADEIINGSYEIKENIIILKYTETNNYPKLKCVCPHELKYKIKEIERKEYEFELQGETEVNEALYCKTNEDCIISSVGNDPNLVNYSFVGLEGFGNEAEETEVVCIPETYFEQNKNKFGLETYSINNQIWTGTESDCACKLNTCQNVLNGITPDS